VKLYVEQRMAIKTTKKKKGLNQHSACNSKGVKNKHDIAQFASMVLPITTLVSFQNE
jgi:hypothetical protein